MGAQAGGADKVEGVDNMYIVTKELSSDSQEYRLEFYFQETSEGIAVTLLNIHGLSLGFCQKPVSES